MPVTTKVPPRVVAVTFLWLIETIADDAVHASRSSYTFLLPSHAMEIPSGFRRVFTVLNDADSRLLTPPWTYLPPHRMISLVNCRFGAAQRQGFPFSPFPIRNPNQHRK